MEKHHKTIRKIYDLCEKDNESVPSDEPNATKHSRFSSKSSDKSIDISTNAMVNKILLTLRYNLNKDTLTIPVAPKRKYHSFVSSISYIRNKDIPINMHNIVSDGYKLYNQAQGREKSMEQLATFRNNFVFNNYKKTIPAHKLYKSSNGEHYDIDDVVMLMIFDNMNDPNDFTNKHYLCENEVEENIIIGHPGLSSELRDKYMLRKLQHYDNIKEVCSYIDENSQILDQIAQFGLLFLNFELSEVKYKEFINALMNLVGNIDSPLFKYRLINSTTFGMLLINAANEKPSQMEFGYYLLLLYFQIHYNYRKIVKENLCLLPYFVDISSSCDTTVFIGTIAKKALDPIVVINPTHQQLDKIGDHYVFLYTPEKFPNQLVLTSHTIDKDLREEFTQNFDEQLLNLNEYCPGILKVLDSQKLDRISVSNNLIKLYNFIESNLNQ